MNDFIGNYISFITSLSFGHFIRLFWFYIIFEFSRYFVLEFIFLNLDKLSKYLHKDTRVIAKEKFLFDNPLISILVPGKNEGKHLSKLVNSLNEQTYQNIEIIVVDDGSDDDTPTIGLSLQKAGKIDLFLRNEVRGGKASAANLAFRYAKGKYIVHVDADCSYDRDAIEKIIIPFYMDEKIGGVGGNVLPRNYKQSLATTLQAIEYYDTISVGRRVTSYIGWYRIISGAFGAFKKELLDNIGGWDIGPGLDGDITVKIRKMGYKIHFEPEAVCLTSVPKNFRILAKQRLRWDKSIIRFRLRKHNDVLFPSQHFKFSNFFSFVENIGFSVVLNIKWFIYLGDMVFNYPSIWLTILITNILLYTSTNYLKFVLYSLFRTRKNAPMSYFLIYIPCMVLYFGFFLRIVRTIAHFQEFFFKKSYNDPWNPLKTSRHAKKMGL